MGHTQYGIYMENGARQWMSIFAIKIKIKACGYYKTLVKIFLVKVVKKRERKGKLWHLVVKLYDF